MREHKVLTEGEALPGLKSERGRSSLPHPLASVAAHPFLDVQSVQREGMGVWMETR